MLKEAFEIAGGHLALRTELQFYRLAHCPEQHEDARKELEKLISQGAKSENWSFQSNIDRAAFDGHSDIPELCRYAELITGVEHKNPLESKEPAPTKKAPQKKSKKKGTE